MYVVQHNWSNSLGTLAYKLRDDVAAKAGIQIIVETEDSLDLLRLVGNSYSPT